MDDFDTFKASREKIDPSCRKFSEHQWQKAYAAYCSSRERVSEKNSKKSGGGSRRRDRSEKGSSAHAVYASSSPAENLRNEVRQNSAYRDLRMILDLLAWVAIAVVVLAGGVKLAYYTDGSIALVAVLNAAVKVIAIVALRLLLHVVIDIPDIALHGRLFKRTDAGKDQPGSG